MRNTITMGLVAVLAMLSAAQSAAQAPPGGRTPATGSKPTEAC